MDQRNLFEMNVGELMTRWPEVIPVFIRHRYSCVGCSMSRFDTLYEVAANYHIDPEQFLDELLAAVPVERVSE
jgi:hybrid cluster-associated redox disulfide protein